MNEGELAAAWAGVQADLRAVDARRAAVLAELRDLEARAAADLAELSVEELVQHAEHSAAANLALQGRRLALAELDKRHAALAARLAELAGARDTAARRAAQAEIDQEAVTCQAALAGVAELLRGHLQRVNARRARLGYASAPLQQYIPYEHVERIESEAARMLGCLREFGVVG
jgi:hypothetical protein